MDRGATARRRQQQHGPHDVHSVHAIPAIRLHEALCAEVSPFGTNSGSETALSPAGRWLMLVVVATTEDGERLTATGLLRRDGAFRSLFAARPISFLGDSLSLV